MRAGDGRRYGGRDARQRQVERRGRLIDAGLDAFGRDGYAASSVDLVCERAGLTKRYFYESFSDRERLLATVFDQQIAVVRAAVADAVADAGEVVEDKIRAGLTALIDTIGADPRRARVLLIEIVGVSPALEARRREVMHQFVDYIAALVRAEAGRLPADILGIGVMVLVGGVTEVLVDQTLGHRRASTADLVEIITALFMGGYRALAPRREQAGKTTQVT
ncbi:TetR/AcrR family transcriptional regulator [Actinokineospora iranica]|uniref:DNA-binding transcriptional regulator, AcrR family n=1 Tax=Actinokineospora iranica TaxID=1271860 RepID=A0A1G6S4H3_9PSEU|nr:TetR/AcrR family transcriptional regulator [Actinokineospora iranica]SDD11601.1 DNA-binding transcriptional regulator, AcrR family [Actinokineospora iranica]